MSRGWHHQSYRHSLARRGIRTSRVYFRKPKNADDKLNKILISSGIAGLAILAPLTAANMHNLGSSHAVNADISSSEHSGQFIPPVSGSLDKDRTIIITENPNASVSAHLVGRGRSSYPDIRAAVEKNTAEGLLDETAKHSVMAIRGDLRSEDYATTLGGNVTEFVSDPEDIIYTNDTNVEHVHIEPVSDNNFIVERTVDEKPESWHDIGVEIK